MRKLLPFISAIFLTFALAGTALAWLTPVLESDCAPDEKTYAWWITLPDPKDKVEPNHLFDWTYDTQNWAGGGSGNAGSSAPFYFETPRPAGSGPHTLYVRWSSDHDAKTQAIGDPDLCPDPSIGIVKTHDAEGPVDEGEKVTFTYTVTNTGNISLDDVEVVDLIDGGPNDGKVACEVDNEPDSGDVGGDEVMDPGEIWVYSCSVTFATAGTYANEACVIAEVEENDLELDEVGPKCSKAQVVVTKKEGNTGGTVSTPSASLVNSAMTPLPSQSSPIASIAFGLLLVSSLGALAYANVKSGRR